MVVLFSEGLIKKSCEVALSVGFWIEGGFSGRREGK